MPLVLATLLAAQWGAPRAERKTPRAIAVLETAPDGSRRLVPITYFYEHRYYDANLYRATPVPFTLASETVYEVQHSGKAAGLFTVHSATRIGTSAWVGNGQFKTPPAHSELAKKPVAPIKVADPTRPVLHRRDGSEGDKAGKEASTEKAEQDDPDRPILHRQPEAETPEAIAADNSANQPAAEASSLSEGRPILRHGKANQEQSGADLPGNPASRTTHSMMRQVAVSDAAPSEIQDLLYACSEERRKQMEDEARELAVGELRRLAQRRGLNSPQATKALANRAALQLEDEQFVPYDFDYQDYATVVYSARLHLAAAEPLSWVVTIVARQSDGKLRNLYSAVSDPRELELYPEVRLVDAVDPEGYGHFALLFREQKRDGVSWLLGRPTGYELQTLFETATR